MAESKEPTGIEDESEKNNGQSFQERWNWIIAIDRLANEDVLKWNAVTEMPIYEFLTALSFLREKIIYNNNEQERQIKKLSR